MNDKLQKNYIYSMLIMVFLNALFGVIYLFWPIAIIYQVLFYISKVEIFFFIWSVIMLIYIPKKQLPKINLALPIVYLSGSFVIAIPWVWLLILSGGADIFDLNYQVNRIFFAISSLFYISMIIIGEYSLTKQPTK